MVLGLTPKYSASLLMVKKSAITLLAIPMNLATQSEGIWPGVPIERGHLIRSMLAPPSERSDAGVF